MKVLDAMDDWNKNTHGKSGLIDRVRASTVSERPRPSTQMIEFLKEWVPACTSPMCGNSVCQDRRFLARWMPQFEAWFHYRNLDVSTLKELAKRWRPEVLRRREEVGRAHGVGRHPGVHLRTAPLPRQFPAPGMRYQDPSRRSSVKVSARRPAPRRNSHTGFHSGASCMTGLRSFMTSSSGQGVLSPTIGTVRMSAK